MTQLEEKLENNINLTKISNELCEKYQLGKYRDYILIETGLEDFNYCLVTEHKKYLIKIFHKNRSYEEMKDYMEKHKILEKNKIETPKIINAHEKEGLFIIIMEYIEGEDLYSSNESITKQQVQSLIDSMRKIHKIPNKVECIYDDYHFNHFHKAYQLCFSCLNDTWKRIGEKLKEEYDKIDFSKMPKCFIHGDFHKGNIMKDKENNLYLIDFSSCGYSYRIIDVVEFITNTLFDYRELELSQKRIDFFRKHYKLTDYENDKLEVLIKCYAFISYALKEYDYCCSKSQTEESKYWMKNNATIINYHF